MKTARPGEVYRQYKAWCASLGITPADWLTWLNTTAKIHVPTYWDNTRKPGTVVGQT
jgi:hypothetical protein